MNTTKQLKIHPDYLRPRARAFFFHFNKPLTQRAGKPQISVHYKGACHIVDNVICNVPVKGRLSPRQPRFVMAGKGVLTVFGGIAYLS